MSVFELLSMVSVMSTAGVGKKTEMKACVRPMVGCCVYKMPVHEGQ